MSDRPATVGPAGPPAGVLDNLRVVECGSGLAGAICCRILADLGAEVVKVESPAGDPLRRWGPFPQRRADQEASGLFHYHHAGKRSIVIDPGRPTELDRLGALFEGADVLVNSLEAAEAARWGIDDAELQRRHPHLLVASVTPYGRTGPWASLPGTDLTASAASSLCLGLGDPDRSPLRLPFDQAEVQAGLHATAAVLCALLERQRSGQGQIVDVSVADVMAYCVGGAHLLSAQRGTGWGRGSPPQPGLFPSGLYQCADGYVCIASQKVSQWHRIIGLMGDPEWSLAEGARDVVGLGRDPAEVDHHLRGWLMGRTRAQLAELADAHELTLGAALEVGELLDDAHLAERSTWSDLDVGPVTVRVPRPGIDLTATPLRVGRCGPRLGGDLDPAWAPRFLEVTARRVPPLDGVRILDFTRNWAGPMATQLLGDLGADVIRVETAKRQDLMRFLPQLSWFFDHVNRSKRSVAIDVARTGGAALVRALAAKVDVVLDNFSPGVMARHGLDREAFGLVNPGIITVSMTVAGGTGPRRGMRGFAAIGTSFAGLERLVGYEDGTVTGAMPFPLGDVSLAIHATIGTLAALHHRTRTGAGQAVEATMVGAALAGMAEPLLAWQLEGDRTGPIGNRHRAFMPHGLFRCRDGDRWLALAVRDESEFSALRRLLGQPEWPGMTLHGGCPASRVLIERDVASWCVARARDSAVEALRSAGIPSAPLLTVDERDTHDHFVARSLVADPPGASGQNRRYGTPWSLSATPPRIERDAPALGQHTDEVLSELLGLSSRDIAELQADGLLR